MTVTSKWVALHEVSDYRARGWKEVQIIGGLDDAALMVSPEEPASEGGKCVLHEEIVRDGPSKWSCETHTEPEDTDAEHEAAWREFRGKPEPVAAPTSEMPEAVYLAINALRQESQYWAQNGVEVASTIFALRSQELESWWHSQQTQPAPAKVRMTEELKDVLAAANAKADRDSERGNDKQANEVWNAIAAVRAQVEQAQAVRLPKVREGLDAAIERMEGEGCDCNEPNDPPCALCLCKVALDELDAAEKVTE